MCEWKGKVQKNKRMMRNQEYSLNEQLLVLVHVSMESSNLVY